MKKFLPILLVAASLSLTACGNNTAGPNNSTVGGTNNMTNQSSNAAGQTNNGTGQNSQIASQSNNATGQNTGYVTENIKITSSSEALSRLKAGNQRFVSDASELINVTSDRRNALTDGQDPYAIIVSCSDSRVTPSIVFNAGLGEIFDIRIAGNVVDDDALGSIEYAVEHLHSPLLVIMGHEKCGAVTAAYDSVKNNTPVEGELESIIEEIEPSARRSTSVDEAIHQNINAVYNEVCQNPIVKQAVSKGDLAVVKAYYSLDGTRQSAFYVSDSSAKYNPM